MSPARRSTTTTLPTLWCPSAPAAMALGALHVRPPSVVLENMAGPRNRPSGLVVLRFQTAYATPARVGWAVTDSLSLKWTKPLASDLMVRTRRHVRPPSTDVAAVTAFRAVPASLNDKATAYARPSGPMETQGSVARS